MTEIIGYWNGGPGNITKYCDIIPNWSYWDKYPDRFEAVCDYLANGYHDNLTVTYLGWSTCRFSGEPNGTAEYSDGALSWPDGLLHYVKNYRIKLPLEVVSYIVYGAPLPTNIWADFCASENAIKCFQDGLVPLANKMDEGFYVESSTVGISMPYVDANGEAAVYKYDTGSSAIETNPIFVPDPGYSSKTVHIPFHNGGLDFKLSREGDRNFLYITSNLYGVEGVGTTTNTELSQDQLDQLKALFGGSND